MELFRLIGRIVVDNTEANNAIEETANQADESNQKTGKSFKEIGSAAVSVGKWIAGAGAAIGGSILAVTESTREYRTEMGKLDTAFQTSGFSSATAKETYMALNGVLGDSAVATEAANHLAKLTDNEQELQTWTNICTGVFATFGDSLPIEGLTESANETAKVGQITGSLADALNWAGVSEDKFNEQLAKCSTEQERQQLITSTLNGIYAESAEKYKEVNKDVIAANEANARLTDSFSLLGSIFEPIVTAVKNKIAEVFGNIYSTIKEKIESARNRVKEAIDKIKGFFNISLKFNAVKLPSISVSWAKKPAILAKAAELLDIPGVPKFSVSWNAMGGILTKPTIFGIGNESLLGGGEAGDEAILPIETLRSYIKEEMNNQNKGIMDLMQSMVFLLQKYLPEIASSGIVLDSGVLVGELTPLIDRNLGTIQQRKRGR